MVRRHVGVRPGLGISGQDTNSTGSECPLIPNPGLTPLGRLLSPAPALGPAATEPRNDGGRTRRGSAGRNPSPSFGQKERHALTPYWQQPAGPQGCTALQQGGTGQQTVTGTCLHTTTGTHRVTV